MNITLTTTLGQLVAQFPLLTPLLEDWGLDFCCKGERSLEQASKEKGLDGRTILTLILRTALKSQKATQELLGAVVENPAEYETSKLIYHIKYTHHAYLRQVLPEIQTLSSKVAAAHQMSTHFLWDLETEIRTLAQELLEHLQTEEKDLFPFLESTIDQDNRAGLELLLLKLQTEHEAAGEALVRIRTLTNDFSIPDWACLTYRKFMVTLAEFEQDMHRHVHLENSVLFKRFL